MRSPESPPHAKTHKLAGSDHECVPSPSEPLMWISTTASASTSRELQRMRERESRRRRAEKLAKLRTQVKFLEQVATTLPLVADNDTVWDDFLDEDIKQTRAMLRRLTPAARTAKVLSEERAKLRTLLAEHELASRALHDLLQAKPTRPWEREVQRWKALARVHFRRWTDEQVANELARALNEVHQFKSNPTRRSTGLNLMGWEDSLRALQGGSVLQFDLHKTFTNHHLPRHIELIKRMHLETELHTRIILGGRARASVDIIQEITPCASIVMFHEQYGQTDRTVHAVTLVANVETDDGWILYMRSINAPELVAVFGGPIDGWFSKNYWVEIERYDLRQPQTSCDYRTSLGGTLVGDAGYLHLWLFEVLAALIRVDQLLGRHWLHPF